MPTSKRMPTYFISHGGGPWPFMKEEMGPAFDMLEKSLQDIPRQLPEKPKCVLMVSGHWEDSQFAVMSSPKPPMLYDYSGFPERTYHIQYSAAGNPELAARVQALIQSGGFSSRLDEQRGFDHGAFVPMFVMYPNFEVPMVQLSLRKDFDPLAHYELGKLLASLRDEGVLIIGSGLSYHNLRHFNASARAVSTEFDNWLNKALAEPDPKEREKKILQWTQAPGARAAHPREDHLMPLHVALGAAGHERSTCIYHEENIFGGVTASSFRFG